MLLVPHHEYIWMMIQITSWHLHVFDFDNIDLQVKMLTDTTVKLKSSTLYITGT